MGSYLDVYRVTTHFEDNLGLNTRQQDSTQQQDPTRYDDR